MRRSSKGLEDSRVERVADIAAAGSFVRLMRSLVALSEQFRICSMMLRYLFPNCKNSDRVISRGNLSERFLNRLI